MGGRFGLSICGRLGRAPKSFIGRLVDVARFGGEAPAELKLSWWAAPPALNDLLNMDYKLFVRTRAAENIYNTVKKFRAATDASIHSLTDSERRILRMLTDSGIQILN